MSVLSDSLIRKLSLEKKMISPFSQSSLARQISYGLSAYGYDIRLAKEFRVFRGKKNTLLDPKNVPAQSFKVLSAPTCIVGANSFILGRSLEYFKIPRDVLGICLGKSTYARAGIVVNVTPLEPEWEGYLTIAICNSSPSPVKIYAEEGIAQVIFLKADKICEKSYKDKKGKYQAQKKITLAKVK
jgi:dCTP deaminase